MSRMIRVTSHLSVILGLMFLVFLVLDVYNPMMNFVDNGISRWLLAALCGCGILRSILTYREQ